MTITNAEYKAAQKLIESLIANQDRLPYANITEGKKYKGWVSDFGLIDINGNVISLDLNKENDLFLMFVLAIVWSRTGPWENSAFFVAYLKVKNLDSPLYWIDSQNCNNELDQRKESVKYILNNVSGIKPRKAVSFRKDIFESINILAKHWVVIKQNLELSESQQDFRVFMNFMRNIEGLGVGRNKMLIKITLILRELRCQQIYENIYGGLCCVPDARVYDACKEIGINLSKVNNIENLIYSSNKIYKLFGDLYDLPLFAYNDLYHT